MIFFLFIVNFFQKNWIDKTNILEKINLMYHYTGYDNISADDKLEHYLEDFLEPNIERYWDEPEGKE